VSQVTYIIIIFVDKRIRIPVGSLGYIPFEIGYYMYIGSGGRNYMKRINRHYRISKKIRWHIDYLTNLYPPIKTYIIEDTDEYSLSSFLYSKNFQYVKGFGCTDKKSVSHLFYFKSRVELNNAIKMISKRFKITPLDDSIFLI